MPAPVERKALSEELKGLRENMETIATLSVQAIERAVAGLDSPDPAVVGDVSAIDREVYGLKERIVRNCVETIALHAPVAKDLRTITVALEVTTDLDRIGRYAKDIAEAAHELHREGDGRESLPKLREMGKLTVGMIRTAVDAYLAGDASSVSHIHADDDAVDQMHDDLFQAIIDGMGRKSITPRTGAECILINRYLERLSDHAVNVGEWVVYLVTGERPVRLPRRHPGAGPPT
jgi:phosphate transport system protein